MSAPVDPKNPSGFIHKEVKSFGYALSGIWFLLRHERHMQIHGMAAVLVIFAAWFFELSHTEWCLAIFAIGLVFTAEAFNSAIEQLTNISSPQHNPLAGKVKDIAAGAVLLAAIAAAIIGILIFLPKLLF